MRPTAAGSSRSSGVEDEKSSLKVTLLGNWDDIPFLRGEEIMELYQDEIERQHGGRKTLIAAKAGMRCKMIPGRQFNVFFNSSDHSDKYFHTWNDEIAIEKTQVL